MRSGSLVMLCAALSILPCLAEGQHKPHEFNFTYGDQVMVVNGIIRGTWFGNSHSAVLIEPIEDFSEEPDGVAPEVFAAGEDVDDFEALPPIGPLGVQPGSPMQSDDAMPVEIDGANPGSLVEEEEVALWELENYPVFALERSGWTRDILVEGDAIVAVVKPSLQDEMHAQLLGIKRTSDGWIGMGFPFPDGTDMETLLSITQDDPVPGPEFGEEAGEDLPGDFR